MKRRGSQTVVLATAPVITATGTVAGPMEGKGPLGETYDRVHKDHILGEATFEKAESKMMQESVSIALEKNRISPREIDYMIAGDLLNQNISATFCARSFDIPFYGVFGACSTLAESIGLGAMLIDGEFADRVVAAVSSHNSCAERQYRYPTEYGSQRPPYSTWTVTGAAAALLEKAGSGPKITAVTTGKVLDLGIKDPFNMGAAMAPAAAHTVIQHMEDLNRSPDYYDLIITGDLGSLGREMFLNLLKKEGFSAERHMDCGLQIFYPEQGVNAGGSGCACSGVVVLGNIYKQFLRGELQKVLVIATGSLHSPTSYTQGESMPAVAHGFVLEQFTEEGKNGQLF